MGGHDETLQPCPFCGGKAVREDIDEGENAGASYVACSLCYASSHLEFGRKENLQSCWNRRTSDEAKIEAALAIASEEGGTDGAHHKTWVIDQMVRALTGSQYANWIAERSDWDEGVPP